MTFRMCIIHFQDTEGNRLQFRKFHGIYWATVGLLDTEKGKFY